MKGKSIASRLISILIVIVTVIAITLFVGISVSADSKTPVPVEKSPKFESVCYSEGENLGVSFENSIMHFLPGENVIVTYSIADTRSITALDYSAEGINVISATVDQNLSNVFTVALSCDPDAVKHKLTFTVSVNDGEIETAYLYAFYNEYGTFLSPFSNFDAKHRYYVYAREIGVMTQEEYEEIRANDVSGVESDITIEQTLYTDFNGGANINSTTSETQIINLQGEFFWVDDSDNSHPLRHVMVQVYKKVASSLVPLATTYTNNSGAYSCEINYQSSSSNNANTGIDIVIRVYAGDSNAMVEIADSGVSYYSQSALLENIVGGTSLTFGQVFYMDYSTSYANYEDLEALGRAFQISQAILTARDYAKEMMGRTPNAVSVYYPFNDECAYNDGLAAICITGNEREYVSSPHSYASWDAIMHEYGHHVQFQMNIADYPTLQELGLNPEDEFNHSSDVNHSDEYNKDSGIKLAWAESWPTVFGILAQYYYSDYLTNIDAVVDKSYEAYNVLRKNIESNAATLGDACEQSIMGVLLDIADSPDGHADSNDNLDFEDDDFFNVTTGNQSKTFSDFIAYFYSEYPECMDELGANLTYYQMATSKPRVQNSSSVSQSTPPTIIWDAQGGSNDYPNNSFEVIIYDAQLNEILRKNVGNVTSYTLTSAEWNSILYTHGTTYRIAISATQTSDPTTGPYISILSINNTKLDLTVTSWTITANSRYAEKVVELQAGDYKDYSVKFSSGGIKIIQTFGTIDAKISIFDYQGNPIANSDDNGYDLNSLISYNFLPYKSGDPELKNNVYTVRVQFYSKTATGKIKLTITPAKDERISNSTMISDYEDITLLNISNSYEYDATFERGYVNVVTVKPTVAGNYTFEIVSNMDTYIYIIDPRSNALVKINQNCADDHQAGNGTDLDPVITLYLESTVKYYVVFAPYSPALIDENEMVDITLIISKE